MDTALRPALVVVGVAAGIALRIWIIRTPELGYVDSDEAVPGLMARHFLHGEFSPFYWGQTYGGTAEVALIAAVFLIVGSHAIVLRLVPLVLYAIGALLVWRIGRRTIGEPGATVAGLLVWLWPPYFVWRSTREYGYYGVLLVCGLTLVLLALRLRERPSLLDATGFGIALGVGWWCSPQIVLVAVPVLAWMAWRCRGVVRYLPALVVGAAVGASPWIVANVRSGWASLTLTPDYAVEPFRSRLHGIFEDGLPEVVGLRVPMTQQWFPNPVLGHVAFWLLLAALLATAVRRRGSLELVAAIAVSVPFLAALSKYTSFHLEPRYLGLLAPVVALLFAALLTDIRLGAIGVALATALSVVGLVRLLDAGGFTPGGAPTTVAPAIRELDRHGATRAQADYWVAFRIMFQTRERIIVEPNQSSRYPRYNESVAQDPHPARIYIAGSEDLSRDRPFLRRSGYEPIAAGPYVLYFKRTHDSSP